MMQLSRRIKNKENFPRGKLKMNVNVLAFLKFRNMRLWRTPVISKLQEGFKYIVKLNLNHP